MPKEQPTLYNVPKTTMWFAIVSIILLVSLIWMVYADYAREWKTWQRKFVQLKSDKLQEEIKAAEQKIDKQKLAELQKKQDEAEANQKNQKKEIRALEKEIRSIDLETVKKKTRAQDLKQYEDSYRYFLEERRLHKDPEAEEYQKKIDGLRPEADKLKLELERLEKLREGKQAELDQFFAQTNTLQKEIDSLLQEKVRLDRKWKSAKPSLVKDILNAPMIDFMAPTLRIQQVVLEDLYDDYHFSKVQKVDRCTTCHLAIDQKGFETAPQPFRTHPKPELFLSPSSPHPLEKTGCTICHGGNGHSVTFVDSAHTPRSEEQKKEWQKKYGWRRLEKWEPNMLPAEHAEASCTKCHRGVVEVPQAERLNKGRKLAETFGCFGCHKVAGFENRWKVGPSLENIQSKVDREWMMRWLQRPKLFRPSTQMPQIFHLENTSEPHDKELSYAAIQGIVTYLMKNSGSVPLTDPPVPGDAARGEKAVKELGCLGCHTAAGVSANDFGPELSGLGSKVKPAWLYSWLKDPKHLSPDTRMPNLRLSDQEAADIPAYLLSQRNADFENQPLPEANTKALDELVMTNLQKTLRREQAEEEMSKMTPEAKLEFVGKQTIGFQGCYACHTIKGFEEAKPIGTELTKEGEKDIHQLDFGLIHLDHTRHAWFFRKLKEPRIFDRGRIRSYYEKLRMPFFNFTDEEAGLLTTFLLSLTEDPVPLEMQKRLDVKDRQIETGRLMVNKFNCAGCHTVDGKEGRIRKAFEDPGAAPPVLDGEGKKVQERWLDGFLKQPVTIRPWLTYRMPTFGFDHDQAKSLVLYFSNLAKEEVSYSGLELPETASDKLEAGKFLFEKFQCIKCHKVDQTSAALGASFLAPDLTLTKERLKVNWVTDWLKDPQVLQPGTMMPTFFPEGQSPLPDMLGGDAMKQIEAIRDYLFRYAPQPEPKGEGAFKETRQKTVTVSSASTQ